MKKTSPIKLNIVDGVIFLVVLSLIVGGYFLFTGQNTTESTTQIRYTITFRNLPAQLVDNIELEHTVRSDGDFVSLGEVFSIQQESSRVRAGFDLYGRPIYRELPTHVTLHLTISGQGTRHGGGHAVNGVAINIGQEISINTPYFWGLGIISAVEVIG